MHGIVRGAVIIVVRCFRGVVIGVVGVVKGVVCVVRGVLAVVRCAVGVSRKVVCVVKRGFELHEWNG